MGRFQPRQENPEPVQSFSKIVCEDPAAAAAQPGVTVRQMRADFDCRHAKRITPRLSHGESIGTERYVDLALLVLSEVSLSCSAK
jgi:hypothetical protein